jgi:hypothetical protein
MNKNTISLEVGDYIEWPGHITWTVVSIAECNGLSGIIVCELGNIKNRKDFIGRLEIDQLYKCIDEGIYKVRFNGKEK